MRYVGPRQIVIDGQPAPVPVWQPDRRYVGLTVVLVGGGPSHADIDLDRVRGWPFIAINSACRKVRPVATPHDMLYFTDNSWAENHPELLRDWPGPVACANRNAKARLGDAVLRIDCADLARRLGAAIDHVGASSGHVAACLATVMGASRLVLIGFECQAIDGRTHGHADYANQDTNHFRERFLPAWHGIGPAIARHGTEIIQATPRSALTAFPFQPLAAALR